MYHKLKNVLGTFKMVRVKNRDFYFQGFMSGMRVYFKKRPFPDQDGCEVWDLTYTDKEPMQNRR